MAGLGRIPLSRRLPFPWRRWRVVLHVEAADEVPDHLPRRTAVLVGPDQSPTWIALDCPCQLHHRLLINVDPSRQPFWRVTNTTRLTIAPSIDDTTPSRRCHFLLKQGRVKWVHNIDEEQNP